MHIALQLPRRGPSARPSVVLGVVLSAALLAACGNSATATPSGTAATPGPTAGASASGTAATASPAASPTASAGEASPSASAGAGVDACALVTPAELAEIVDGDVTGASMLPSGWVASGCSWSGADASFIVSIGTASSFESFGDAAAPDAKARLEQYKQQADGEDVTGIGDGAARSENGMAAYTGDTYVEVEKLILTDDQLTEIVKLLVSKL